MYNRQTSTTASPFRNKQICEVQFQPFDQIKIPKGLRDMRHRFGLLC